MSVENGGSKELRDPTQPLNYSVAGSAKSAIILQAIFHGANRREAIINGKVILEGQSIGNAKVVRIEENRVIYLAEGKTHVLHLRPNIINAAK